LLTDMQVRYERYALSGNHGNELKVDGMLIDG